MSATTTTTTAAAEPAAGRVPFSHLCRLFDRLLRASTRAQRAQMWRQFLEKFREQLFGAGDDSMHTLLRLVVPQLDRLRGPYGMKEHRLAKLYASALKLDRTSRDAGRLLQYKSSGSTQQGGGDFAETVYNVLQHRCPSEASKWSLQEVDSRLTQLAERNMDSDAAGVSAAVAGMVQSLSALEQKWLVRIILKEVHIRIGQKELLKAFHPDAVEYYDVTSCLRKLAQTLTDPKKRMNEAGIALFTPFKPMLSEQSGLESFDKQMKTKPFFIEPKHDGERVQLHKEGDRYMFFSRGGFDFTASYGGSPRDGSLVPHIHAQFTPETRSCILDGEMLVWNDIEKRIIVKAEAPDVKKLKPGGKLRPLFVPFDLVFLNGKILTAAPLRERLEKLKCVYRPLDGWLGKTRSVEASTAQQVVDALNAAIESHEEGLILKDPTSLYVPNARKKGWVKVKPDYVNSLVDELDMLILGGYFGEGARRGTITSFLLGAAEPPAASSHRPEVFCTAGTVTSGLTSEQLSNLRQDLMPHMKKPRKDGSSPPGIKWTKEKPDLWIPPEKSRILQIRATELVESRGHAAGLVPRFARVTAVRSRADKPWHQAVTTAQLRLLRQRADGKLAARPLTAVPEQPATGGGRRAAPAPRVPAHLRPADLTGVGRGRVTSALAGRQLCVMACGDDGNAKQEVERLVHECGGTITQNPGPNTWCIIADRIGLRERALVASERYDMVRSSWLERVRARAALVVFSPREAHQVTPPTRLQMETHYDRFGDAFAEDVDAGGLRRLLEEASDEFDKADVGSLSLPPEIRALSDGAPFHMFAGCRAYFADRPSGGASVAALRLRLHGGAVCDDVMEVDCSHVITANQSEALNQANRARKRKFRVVREDWVLDSVKTGRWLEERAYAPLVSK